MRFYAKLILMIVLFVGLSSQTMRGVAADVAYAARVKYVLTFGSVRDYETLLDDTQRALAAQTGRVDVFEASKRYRALMDERLAEVARLHLRLTDHELELLYARCAREAYGGVAEAMRPAGAASDRSFAPAAFE